MQHKFHKTWLGVVLAGYASIGSADTSGDFEAPDFSAWQNPTSIMEGFGFTEPVIQTADAGSYPMQENLGFPTPESLGFPTPESLGFPMPENIGFPTPENIGFPTPENIGFPMPDIPLSSFPNEAAYAQHLEYTAISTVNAQQIAQAEPGVLNSVSAQQFQYLNYTATSGFNAQQVEHFNPLAVSGFTAQHLNAFDPAAVFGFNAQQTGYLNPLSVSGLTSLHFQNFSSEAISGFSGEQVANFNPAEFWGMSPKDMLRTFLNLDPVKVGLDTMRQFLPEGWDIDPDNGKFKGPPGAPLMFPAFASFSTMPADDVSLPQLPDFSSCFCFGGASRGGAVLNELNDTLMAKGFGQFHFSQNQRDGILHLYGEGEAEGASIALIPDAAEIKQASEDAPADVSQNESGQYVLTTVGGIDIPLIPAPADPEGITQLAGGSGSVELGPRGETALNHPDIGHVMGIFSEIVFPDFENRSTGFHRIGEEGIDEHIDVVYGNGTFQTVRPTVQSPKEFENAVLAIPGAEGVMIKMNGRITVSYGGASYDVVPDLDVVPSEGSVPGEAKFETAVEGAVIFVNGDGDRQSLFISEHFTDDGNDTTDAGGQEAGANEGGNTGDTADGEAAGTGENGTPGDAAGSEDAVSDDTGGEGAGANEGGNTGDTADGEAAGTGENGTPGDAAGSEDAVSNDAGGEGAGANEGGNMDDTAGKEAGAGETGSPDDAGSEKVTAEDGNTGETVNEPASQAGSE
ncbi:MAG: hypothetical protein GY862_34860 [Gammaproteobacteria bacterium]|nr:hypothetical protein [Gammaproteobacteria bacterium]